MPIYRNKKTGVIVDTIAPVSGDTWERVVPTNTAPKEEPKAKVKSKTKKEK